MSILVTGGAGFIGSHTVVELLNEGNEVIVVDNLSNSKIEVIDSIKEITGKNVKFYKIDILDREKLNKVFEENPDITAVIHFAALKAVGESVQKPIEYYQNNIEGTLVLVDVMRKHNVKKIVFSSSATVYGDPATVPIREDFPKSATNPYGQTKLMIEQILSDIYVSDNEWSVVLLRYFNPIGAHESGLIGEDPKGIPNNLMPFIMKVANKEIDHLNIFGNNYKETKDGTCARDFLHVVDLAIGHIKALEKLDKENSGVFVYNLGTGNPYTVQEMVDTFIKVNNVDVPYQFAERREGDLPVFFADSSKAKKELGWVATRTLEDMCRDSWNYVVKNR